MKKTLVVLILSLPTLGFAQQITTFILVRHAERAADMSKDPDLTEEGKQRATRLATMLKETKVDAIYSTAYKRTQATMAPLANAKGLSVETYEPAKNDVIDKMLEKHAGGTVVVCGHSNTIPGIVNYLCGTDQYKTFDDSDYNNLVIVSVGEKGKGKVTWLVFTPTWKTEKL